MKTQVAFALALTLSFTGIVGNHAEAATSKPDLIVSAVSAPSPASPNATVVVSGTVKNQGKASAKAFGVAYYLSTSPSSTTGAAMLGTGNVSSLAAGASVALVTSFTIPGSTASGTFYVVAVADSTKVISESNESNNSRASGAVAVKDLTPPTISAVTTSGITASNATIAWSTNEGGTSQVEYGTTAAYGSATSLNSSLATSHSAGLSSLVAGTLYHFRVRSKDAAGNEALSGDNTFTTAASTASPLTIWVTDALTRVQPTDPSGTVTVAAIKAARNEYEAFQVIIQAPSTQALSNVNVVASDLVGPGLIDKSNVTLYREHYIQVTTSSPGASSPPGWWPDALIPFVNPATGQSLSGGRFPAAPFSVSAGQNQPVWIEVFVPKGTPAGIYSGTVTVTADNASSVLVPVTVTVWGFTLPDKIAMRSHFGSFWALSGRYNLSWTDYLTMDQLYSNVFLNHRIQISPAVMSPSRAADGTIQVSASNHTAFQQWFSRANSYYIGFLPTWPFNDPLGADRPKALNYLRSFAQYLRTNGWLQYAFVYPIDEPNSAMAYQQVRDLATLIHEADPELKVLTTVQPIPDNSTWGNLIGSVNTWVPLMQNFDPVSVAERLAAGDEVWDYTALDQGASQGVPVWLLDYPLINNRVASWINGRYELRGLLYWNAIYWEETSDPWTNPLTYRGQYNSEGSLVYPGRELGIGYDGPIPSIRLKALRDGAEDYEYLTLVRDLGDSTYANQQALQIGSSITQWSRNPSDMAAARESLANRILQLGGQ